MNSRQWTIVKRVIRYEWDYLFRKFQLWESLVFVISIISVVITGLGDTQSFFISENSIIPSAWSFLKNPKTALFISICVLVLPVICVWYLDQKQKRKDNIELFKTIKDNVVPGINLALEELKTTINKKFRLNGNIRISLWISVKKSFFEWNLQMVCKTKNVPDKELEASFELQEGVIGYTYLNNKRKYALEFIDVSDLNNLPEGYIALHNDNQLLINSNIKSVLAIGTFQENSIFGLLAIDTDSIDDLSKMQENELHSLIVDWIVQNSGVVSLLWRMKNNV